MGYLVCFSAIPGLASTERLHDLPASMPWRAYRIAKHDLVMVEWFRRPNRNNPPPHNQLIFPARPEFCRRPVGITFSKEFGAAAPGLDHIAKQLATDRRAGTLPKSVIHAGLLLNQLTGCTILSIGSDDEEWDMACEIRDGQIDRLIFLAGDEKMQLDRDGHLEVTPCTPPHLIHGIADREATAWCADFHQLFGFDGDAALPGMVEVDRVRHVPEAPARILPLSRSSKPKPSGKPFWKFWS